MALLTLPGFRSTEKCQLKEILVKHILLRYGVEKNTCFELKLKRGQKF